MAATGANIFILRVPDHQPETEASRNAIWAVLFSCQLGSLLHNLPTEGEDYQLM
jgi:hypothetical protein